ncbi:hypothetical protein [Clostridium ihumii]|uniref:hypothetical protein n=1 Tax=Clostridium ihumii TaxID=1470356 RepID=UPI003D326CB6
MKYNLFDEVWNRIVKNEGNTFKTKRGLDFTYKICNDGLVTSRTQYKLSKSEFKKVFDMMPLKGPGVINNIVRGPAYIWAILNDKRICLE